MVDGAQHFKEYTGIIALLGSVRQALAGVGTAQEKGGRVI